MKLITKKTDYAIRALGYIAKRNDVVTVCELSNALRIPQPFLRGILQVLNKHGVLKSYKGYKGGFLLNKAIDNIMVIDIINLFQGDIKLTECLIRNDICPDVKKCRLRKELNEIANDMESRFRSISIESLISDSKEEY